MSKLIYRYSGTVPENSKAAFENRIDQKLAFLMDDLNNSGSHIQVSMGRDNKLLRGLIVAPDYLKTALTNSTN